MNPMDLPIGLQLYTVRDQLAADLDGTCKAVRDQGYTHAEVGPFGGRTTEQVANAARSAGMELIASHEADLMFPEKAGDAVKKCRDLGIPYAIQPFQMQDRRSADDYKMVAEKLTTLSGDQVTCLYHNHDFEFEKVDGDRTGWEVLFDGTRLHAEMDTCWVEVGGASAVDWLKRLESRVPLVHVKDCRDYGKRELCEVGTGRVPVPSIVAAAAATGAKYLVVEQDNNWLDGDPVKSAGVSYENLRRIVQESSPAA